ncbi:MAG TPA: GNAT family N-acetyltransferase [Candidatus Izemoplasmatales bacterium]|nr:GNAT family N-acetyltransferase [Candidatus Izemoplasmatales bacterium]
MEIRCVHKHDLDEWLHLRKRLWPKDEWHSLENEMHEIFNALDEHPVFIAQDKGVIIGFIELSIHQSAPGCHSNRIGYLEGWYVCPTCRNKGIGKKLVEAGETWAKHKGCSEMASDTNEMYPMSLLAHIRLGYKESKEPFHYYKKLII